MKYGVTPKDLETFNTGRKGTWGWSGCGSLNAYLNIVRFPAYFATALN
jgi:hypothetical protein